ncbi:hypothetical protein FHS55_004609 [Angulomicrobium tetraedrale]|uniref:Uncharacterized protein n=1 Tax=Ancylobacter tetraedralis TaxID=217068 RepID=A0A839ZGJ0_9HYPH|nr:hypothetical protein [Ancylobacter tetraedralis]
MSILGFEPITVVSAIYVLGFAGMMIVAFDAVSDRGQDGR